MKKSAFVLSIAFLSLIVVPSLPIQALQNQRQSNVSAEERMILQNIASLNKKKTGIELSIKVLQKSIAELNSSIAEKEKKRTRLAIMSSRIDLDFQHFKSNADAKIKVLTAIGDMAGIAKVKASLARKEAQTRKQKSGINSDIKKLGQEIEADKKRRENLKKQLKLKEAELQKTIKEIKNLELKLKILRTKK